MSASAGRRRWTDQEIVADVSGAQADTGVDITREGLVQAAHSGHVLPSHSTIESHFGSFHALSEAVAKLSSTPAAFQVEGLDPTARLLLTRLLALEAVEVTHGPRATAEHESLVRSMFTNESSVHPCPGPRTLNVER
jgi:hypothetical protein